LADLSFDLNEAPAIPTPVSAPEVLVPEAMGLDFPSSQSTADVKASEAEKLPEFDLSDIELDLSPSAEPASSVASAPAELPSLEGLVEEEPYTSNAEMATKLDLAIAYQDIGDKEGARELLEEVVKGGDPDQSEKAKNLLGKLS
jgi:pilus assembly protein FimV